MRPYYESDGVTIYHADCREVLPHIADSGLVFTSPPYAAQRTYGFAHGEFRWDEVVPHAMASVRLAPAGQMLVNLGLIHRDGELVTYWDPMLSALRAAGLRLFGWYVWDQLSGLPGKWNGRFAPSHEWLFHFNRQASSICKIEVCRSQGRRLSGDTIRKPDGATKPFWSKGAEVQPFKVPDSVVRMHRANASHDGSGHPAPFPLGLAAYILRAFDCGSVLDPFMGSGTTLCAAKDLGRRAIGIEIEEAYCEVAAKRLSQQVLSFETAPRERHEQIEID